MSSESSTDEEYIRKRKRESKKDKEITQPRRRYGRDRSHSPKYHRSRSTERSRSGHRFMLGDRKHCYRRSEDRSRRATNETAEKGMPDHSTKPDDRDKLGGRAREKLSVLAKLGIELKLPEQGKKKKLWNKEKAPETIGTAWKAASFSDGKLTAKFQRLMGIKTVDEGGSDKKNVSAQDQEQLFRRMEAEYEVARQTTHTLRGAGLGFNK